jgi:plasmid stabilization system protein ParE
MSVQLVITGNAKAALRGIDDWWGEHQPERAQLFLDEVDRALELLRVLPGVGPPYLEAGAPNIRRLLLPKTQHHIYYEYVPDDSILTVLTVWNCRRGQEPDLSVR